MNRIGFDKRWLACVVLVVGGCGAVPDFLLEAGRDAAKETLEKSIEEAIENVLGGGVDDLWNSIDMPRPLDTDDEAGEDAEHILNGRLKIRRTCDANERSTQNSQETLSQLRAVLRPYVLL